MIPDAPADPAVLMDLFPQEQRSTVAQYFYRAARHGTQTPDAIYYEVLGQIWQRRSTALRYAEQPAAWQPARARLEAEGLAALYAVLATHRTEGEAFATYVLWREALPPEARSREKSLRYVAARNAARESEPPTTKQVAYLRALGYTAEVETKAAASSLIDRLVRRRRE